MSKRKTQKQMIEIYLLAGNAITPIEALELFGCFRLAAIIHQIREKRHVYTTMITNKYGNRFAKYSLKPSDGNVWNNKGENILKHDTIGW